ncbi:MAG TPA: hypothetical protein VG694_02250 [Candidatus Paceibacterota bacterium]|jgi:hypothetical protein|nr:hypothetical protein [Candidatus Paceibacterota bacterium]
MKYFTNVFLNIESRARRYFEKYPFTHAFLAGVGVILFWRGAWEVADRAHVGPYLSILIGALLLGGIGLFVQTFVGNAIIIRNVERGKQLEQKAKQGVVGVEKQVEKEEITLSMLSDRLERIEEKVNAIIMNK